MPGILYVVATPIGNLEDVTLRALRVLREATVIAAEDTRRTARLLQHYSISTPTTSLHEHNEHSRAAKLIDRMLAGESVALVSDAGTPVISDPGSRLIAAAHDRGIRVEPIPGPNAAIAVLSGAGWGDEGFLFAGFPPPRSSARKKWFQDLAREPRPIVIYEAPHRILATLSDISEQMGDRKVALGRELTKSHEQLVIRPIKEWVAAPPLERGEFALVISGFDQTLARDSAPADDTAIAIFFGRMTENSEIGRREAIKRTAEHFKTTSRAVFAALDREKDRSTDIN
jgi:16S rRNA (cytidine1402-2'-O)-methyltransferase